MDCRCLNKARRRNVHRATVNGADRGWFVAAGTLEGGSGVWVVAGAHAYDGRPPDASARPSMASSHDLKVASYNIHGCIGANRRFAEIIVRLSMLAREC
jgi:hypothetical protein